MLNIAFIADSGYVLPSVVAITSLLINKKDTTVYKIYFLSIGLTEEEKNKISATCQKYNTELLIIDVDQDKLKEKYSQIGKHECCANTSALIKFDLPSYCPDDTILYLDGDIIVQSDLSDLESIALDDNTYVAAVPESGILYNKIIIRQNIDNYFNSGVMLLNLKGIRANNISEKLYLAKLASTDSSLMDQHVFNEVFNNHKIILDHKYNVLFTSIIRASHFHGIDINQINSLFSKEYEDFDSIKRNAAVIHYSTFDKPWKYSDIDAIDEWNRYYLLSEYKDQALKRKKLHIKQINKMREHKILGLVGTFWWECETRGLKKALSEVKTFLFHKG